MIYVLIAVVVVRLSLVNSIQDRIDNLENTNDTLELQIEQLRALVDDNKDQQLNSLYQMYEKIPVEYDKTDLVFLSGGDQTKLVSVLHQTKLFHEIRMKFYNGELHIAGTSAGAAAASNPMLYDGDYQGFQKEAINSAEGFGFLPTVTIDTHFLQRERISRLSQFCLSGRSNKGIGLDEDTAIMIYPDNKFTVIGSGMVTLINIGRLINSNYYKIQKDETINFNNLRIGFISEGVNFSIRRWMILKK